MVISMDANTIVFSVWFLIGAALVFWMQAGFAMVEAGFTRLKNTGNIIMKNLMDFCIGTVVFIVIGFGLFLGEDLVGLIGKPGFDIFTAYESFDWSAFVFNLVFCATAATIVSGAMAERTKFLSYCIYSGVISALIYPIEAHWIWGGGWLAQLGFHDFAGSCAIHMVGGISALIGAKMLGPRIGKFTKDENGKIVKVNAFPGHSIALGALGVFILWLGWYGFNGAAAQTVEELGSIFLTTTVAPAVATVIIQGIGHGDLIQDKNGDWHILSLGFRQMGIWMPFHSLGREVFLSPAHFDENGRLFAGLDGTTDAQYEIKGDFAQDKLPVFTFGNTNPSVDWCYLRKYHPENYKLSADKYELCGTDLTLDDADSPTFIAMRQRDFDMELCVNVNLCGNGEGGVTMYMCENEHYDIALKKTADGTFAILKLNIGGIKHEQNRVAVNADNATLIVRADHYNYNFFVKCGDTETHLGSGQVKYLTSEVSGGFTGTMTGLYAVGGTAQFTGFSCAYTESEE